MIDNNSSGQTINFPDPRDERFWIWKEEGDEWGIVDNFLLHEFWKEYAPCLKEYYASKTMEIWTKLAEERWNLYKKAYDSSSTTIKEGLDE